MTRAEAVSHINSTNGKVFAVRFIKRSTGEVRTMNCRLGVKSHLKGGAPAYSREEKQLVCVFDMVKNAYRSIPIEGITELKVDGEWQSVN